MLVRCEAMNVIARVKMQHAEQMKAAVDTDRCSKEGSNC